MGLCLILALVQARAPARPLITLHIVSPFLSMPNRSSLTFSEASAPVPMPVCNSVVIGGAPSVCAQAQELF